MMRARLIRFFGFSHSEVNQMSFKDIALYYKCITHIQSEEMLNDITASSAHAMSNQSRKDLHKKLDRLRYKEDQPVMTFDQLAGKQWQR